MMAFGIKATLAAAIMALGAAPALSQAQESPQARFNTAVNALNTRLGTVETGPAIDSTDAAANAADLAAIEQAVGSLGSPAFPLEGFATFGAVCEPLNKLAVRFALDGLPALSRPAGAPPLTPDETTTAMGEVRALQLRNVVRHQDAVTILSGNGIGCMVKLFPALTAHLAGLPPEELTPTRLGGVRQMRLGGTQAMLGFMISLRETTTTPANKVRLRAYVADIAQPLAAALTPEQRTNMITTLAGLPPTQEADVLAVTEVLKSALATTECTGLCRY